MYTYTFPRLKGDLDDYSELSGTEIAPFSIKRYIFKVCVCYWILSYEVWLTHWGRVTHTCICVSKLTITGSDNGLSPGRRQAIIWTNAGILLIRTLGTNFIEILGEIQTISFKTMRLKMSSAKWRPLCLGLNVFWLNFWYYVWYLLITGVHKTFEVSFEFICQLNKINHSSQSATASVSGKLSWSMSCACLKKWQSLGKSVYKFLNPI